MAAMLPQQEWMLAMSRNNLQAAQRLANRQAAQLMDDVERLLRQLQQLLKMLRPTV